MQATWNIAETGVNFTDSLTACDIYKINNDIKQPIRNDPGKSEVTERLQLGSTNLSGPVTRRAGTTASWPSAPTTTPSSRQYTLILTRDKALTTQVKFVQDFVMPLGLSLQHLHADGGGEFIADFSTARQRRSCSNSAHPTLQSEMASANGTGAGS